MGAAPATSVSTNAEANSLFTIFRNACLLEGFALQTSHQRFCLWTPQAFEKLAKNFCVDISCVFFYGKICNRHLQLIDPIGIFTGDIQDFLRGQAFQGGDAFGGQLYQAGMVAFSPMRNGCQIGTVRFQY